MANKRFFKQLRVFRKKKKLPTHDYRLALELSRTLSTSCVPFLQIPDSALFTSDENFSWMREREKQKTFTVDAFNLVSIIVLSGLIFGRLFMSC